MQGNARERGRIRLSLQVSTNSNGGEKKNWVCDQHRRLLKILLTDELLARNSDQYEWKDDFKPETLHILAQHAVQGRMSRLATAMTRWIVYTQIHAILPLDYRVFNPILDKIRVNIHAQPLRGKVYKILFFNYYLLRFN